MSRIDRRLTGGLAAIVAVLGLLIGAVAVFAYPGDGGPTASETAGCTNIPQGGNCPITFHLVDANGNPISGATVNHSVSGVPGASVNPTSSVTNSAGNATTTLIAPAVGATGSVPGSGLLASMVLAASPACGPATVTGTSSGTSASTQVNVTCPSGSSSLLPTASTDAPGGGRLAAGIVALAVLVVAGGLYALRSTRRRSASGIDAA